MNKLGNGANETTFSSYIYLSNFYHYCHVMGNFYLPLDFSVFNKSTFTCDST